MNKFTGKGVYGAIAIGKILKFQRRELSVKRKHIEDADSEKSRLATAKELAVHQLQEIYEKALKEVGEANAQIFEIHMMMIEDEDYNESIKNIIETQMVNTEYAVAVTSDNFSAMFGSMEDSYMKARAADIRDISNRIISNLSAGERENVIGDEKVIICADDLAPSETVLLDKEKVLAFVTAFGSSNSHTAILARNMNIPAIIGVGSDFLDTVKDGDYAVVDGFTGEIFVNPDAETTKRLQKKQQEDEEKKRLLQNLKGKENVTLDGTKINIYANIGGVDNIGAVLLNDAGGIGLFRSEFLYLENSDYPSEEQQFAAYKKVLESMAGKKVIIRTLDIGADKQVDYFNLAKEENPAMGYRAIRICLTRPEIFKTQLRALYRASAYGNLGIMFPMITSIEEVKLAKLMLEKAKKELKKEKTSFDSDIPVGVMIETPAAVMISGELAREVDFFSIGTNDLLQLTLGMDRQNERLERYFNPHHSALLKMIRIITNNVHLEEKHISICGDMAADLEMTEYLIQIGIDELSVAPNQVLALRKKIREIQ